MAGPKDLAGFIDAPVYGPAKNAAKKTLSVLVSRQIQKKRESMQRQWVMVPKKLRPLTEEALWFWLSCKMSPSMNKELDASEKRLRKITLIIIVCSRLSSNI